MPFPTKNIRTPGSYQIILSNGASLHSQSLILTAGWQLHVQMMMMMWFTDRLLATGFCSITLFSSQKLMMTWKQKMNAEAQIQSWGKTVDWVNSQIQKEEWGRKKSTTCTWNVLDSLIYTRHWETPLFWRCIDRLMMTLPLLLTSWETPGSSYYTYTDKQQSIKLCLYVCSEREDTKTWTIKTQTCHIKLSFPRWISNAHFTFKISMIDKCVKKVSAI